VARRFADGARHRNHRGRIPDGGRRKVWTDKLYPRPTTRYVARRIVLSHIMRVYSYIICPIVCLGISCKRSRGEIGGTDQRLKISIEKLDQEMDKVWTPPPRAPFQLVSVEIHRTCIYNVLPLYTSPYIGFRYSKKTLYTRHGKNNPLLRYPAVSLLYYYTWSVDTL
jgi:hypothetical protein